jgi:NAD(P)H-hydrate epimerase
MTRLRPVRTLPRLPRRRPDAHKGDFGTVLVVAGSDGMLGAAILAARGALRGGAGLVRVCLPPELQAPLTIAVPPATTIARRGDPRAWLAGCTVLALGSGMPPSPGHRRIVHALVRATEVPLVLDAGGCDAFAPLRRRIPCRAPFVITPHPGEAARLLGTDASAVQADRRGAVAELARRSGGIALLKGQRTLVCDGARIFANRTGNPGLASGGSGDVLTGLLAALIAQGLAPFEAACLGAHLHGAAGDRVAARLSQPGLNADDLPLAIAELLR